jgi:hypothetical protein
MSFSHAEPPQRPLYRYDTSVQPTQPPSKGLMDIASIWDSGTIVQRLS